MMTQQDVTDFQKLKRKSITLLGMSGVGKTFLSAFLRKNNWYHYSGDYRIGSRYLSEVINDELKKISMINPEINRLLHSDSIHIGHNITIKNLDAISFFLGKLGSDKLGGLSLETFRYRQQLHRDAEILAMLDVPEFIDKSRKIYQYSNFVNDAGGSLCEVDDHHVYDVLAENTTFIYIKASESDLERLMTRASESPKPLYYRPEFLDSYLPKYLLEKGGKDVSNIDPDEFVRWVFPFLLDERIPRFEALARKNGFTIESKALNQIQSEADFFELLY